MTMMERWGPWLTWLWDVLGPQSHRISEKLFGTAMKALNNLSWIIYSVKGGGGDDPLPDMMGTKYHRRNGTWCNIFFPWVLRSALHILDTIIRVKLCSFELFKALADDYNQIQYARTLNTGLDADGSVVCTEHVMLLYSRGQQISS